MSASPIQPPDPDVWADAAKAAPLGAAAMLARGLLSTEKLSWGWVFRSSIAAGAVSVLAGLALKDHITSESTRLFVVGLCGFAAPEIIDYGIRNAPRLVEMAMAKIGLKPNAPKGKARAKRRR